MTDATLIQELSTAPSYEWPKRIARHDLVLAYLRLPKPSTADVDRFANLAGMSRRMFYRLLANHKHREAGTFPERKVVSRGCTLRKQQDQIVAKAIANVAPDSTCKRVLQEVSRLSLAHDEVEPSDFTVRARLRAQARVDGLRSKVAGYCSLLIDACCTDLTLRSDHRNDAPAWLLALFDPEAGEFLATALSFGPPSSLDYVQLLVGMHGRLEHCHAGEPVIGVTSVVAKHNLNLPLVASDAAYVFRRLDGVLRSGEGIQFILGREIGRVQLRLRPRRVPAQRQFEGAPIDVAKAVVDSLISQSNAAARASPS